MNPRLVLILAILTNTFLCIPVVAQKPNKAAQKRIARELKKLDLAKSKYEKARKKDSQQLLAVFDKAIKTVDQSRLAVDVKSQIKKGLRESKDTFIEDSVFTKIPAFQKDYIDYIVKSNRSYSNLMKAYDGALRRMPESDARTRVEAEIEEYSSDIRKLDSIRVGQKWVGFRMDNDRGPVFKETLNEMGQYLKLERVRNTRVDVEFTLRIDKRQGDSVEGTITQNGGRFVAVVSGTYDGVTLNLAMTRMVRGAERYFEYSGDVVGNYGLLNLRGRKTNGVLTTGRILLESAD